MAKPDLMRTPVLRMNQEWQRTPDPIFGEHAPKRDRETPTRLIGTCAPGTRPQIFRPGTALRLERGGVIELQIHYTANGTAASDRSLFSAVVQPRPGERGVR